MLPLMAVRGESAGRVATSAHIDRNEGIAMLREKPTKGQCAFTALQVWCAI